MPSRLSIGSTAKFEIIIITAVAAIVRVMLLPILRERFSFSFAPKYWLTIIPVPVDMPINITSSRLKTGLDEPTAARALSPTYLPTTMLSTVL